MLEEGRHYAKLAPNIVVKVAMSENGLEAISRFAEEGIKTNCTLIFTANQGLLAAKAGASLISPFVGRLDDINQDGMIVIRELAEIFAIHEIESEVLAASIRKPLHMTQAALAGAHIATLPFKVLQQMVHHPLTDKGIVQFKADWQKAHEAAAPAGKALNGGFSASDAFESARATVGCWIEGGMTRRPEASPRGDRAGVGRCRPRASSLGCEPCIVIDHR